MRNNKEYVQLLILLLLSVVFFSCEPRQGKIKDLQGQWKFTVGDDKQWAAADFDDSQWDRIYVPSSWESQGYKGYNGYAWYRKDVRLPHKVKADNLYLFLGRIDDVDEVYFNGKLVGKTGIFPPDYESAYSAQRKYFIPRNLINYDGDNIIAVRIYDERESGGIEDGILGFYIYDALKEDIDLSGTWKFQTGDSMHWKDEYYDDSKWNAINVPSYWEIRGYEDYDGLAWYRKKFDLPTDLKNKKLVLLMGKIDDIDEVYVNGELVGHSGNFNSNFEDKEVLRFWNEYRGYYLPDNFQLKDTANVISVRVYDAGGGGGIYEGPLGIITQDNYLRYWRNIHKTRKH